MSGKVLEVIRHDDSSVGTGDASLRKSIDLRDEVLARVRGSNPYRTKLPCQREDRAHTGWMNTQRPGNGFRRLGQESTFIEVAHDGDGDLAISRGQTGDEIRQQCARGGLG